MDLLDDSGDETNAGRMVAEVDENILLNSDDEEGSPMKAHNNHVGVDEEELLYEGDDDEYLEDDPEDVLDLELGEDELETPDSTLGHIAVKLRPAFDESHAIYETGEGDHGKLEVEDETGVTSTEDHVVSESPSSSRVKPTADSDDDEDSPRQRTRFLTERKTEDISKHSGPSEGNPITTLGERNQRPVHGSPNSSRGNRGGFGNRGKHFGQRGGGVGMQNLRQRPPSLLGDRPRPALLRFPTFNQPRMHPNDHMHQLQGGFIDFNKPIIRPINKSPMKKLQQVSQTMPAPNLNEHEKSSGANQHTNMPTQSPTNITIMNKTIHNPGAGMPKRTLVPRPMMNRPMRPPRPVVNRPNPFLIMDPNLPGHPRGQRMHQRPPMHQHLHNPGFRQQWNQQPMGPRGIPVVIPGGNHMMPPGPCLEPEPFNNFNNGPQGILGPPPPNGPNVSYSEMPPNGFRQPFLPPNQPRFPPEEMIHQHLQQQHQVFMPQNYPMGEPLQQQQPPFMRPPVEMDFQRHRAPSPQMHFNHQMPPQPLRQNEFRFQGQHPPEQGGWPMQQQQQQHPEMQFQQQQQQQPPQQHLPKPNATNRSNFGIKLDEDHHRNRPNPFYITRHDQSDNYNNGNYEDRRDRSEFQERLRTNYESKSSYESVSSKDYHDKDSYDYDRRRDYDYDDYEHESRSSQYRPPLKRPNEVREEYRPEKRSYGSPEKRLDGRLGPPVSKNKEVHEEMRRQEEAIKITRESQKVMGVDNDYLRRIEEQKEMRERILREKEHRRKKQQGGGNSPEESFLEENTESRREVRIVKPNVSTQSVSKPRPEVRIQATSSSDGAKVVNKSIYINPRAFRGDLSAFKSSGTDSDFGSRAVSQSRTTAPTATVESSVPAPTVTMKPTVGVVAKKRTILRIVRNKKGEIISKSKVVVLPKGSLVGGSTTTNQHAS